MQSTARSSAGLVRAVSRWQIVGLSVNALAETENPSLKALREREKAAGWGAKAAGASFFPTVSLSASWGGWPTTGDS